MQNACFKIIGTPTIKARLALSFAVCNKVVGSIPSPFTFLGVYNVISLSTQYRVVWFETQPRLVLNPTLNRVKSLN